MRLKDKVAIVTGAAQGIGKAIATELAREGCMLVVNDVKEEKLIEVVEEIKEFNDNVFYVVADVSNFIETERMVNLAIKEFGTIDILINNAGITRDNLVTKIKDNMWDMVLDVNLKGPFNCIKGIFNIMANQNKGKIINIASISGQIGNMGQANYCASKAGVIGLTKCMAKEGARYNINVNAVAPGFIDTEMTQVIPEKIKEKIIKNNIPMGRIGQPKDIALASVFLASEDSDYITGQVISVNGGWYM